jgi:hypothetical protein
MSIFVVNSKDTGKPTWFLPVRYSPNHSQPTKVGATLTAKLCCQGHLNHFTKSHREAMHKYHHPDGFKKELGFPIDVGIPLAQSY